MQPKLWGCFTPDTLVQFLSTLQCNDMLETAWTVRPLSLDRKAHNAISCHLHSFWVQNKKTIVLEIALKASKMNRVTVFWKGLSADWALVMTTYPLGVTWFCWQSQRASLSDEIKRAVEVRDCYPAYKARKFFKDSLLRCGQSLRFVTKILLPPCHSCSIR